MTDRKHPLAECEICPLREVGTYVPSQGPETADIAFVGEAPGIKEARSGQCFTGPAGQLLDAVNTHHGINREDVFLSNATLCRPPDNGPPPVSAIVACRPRLVGELQEHSVSTVVALGNSASISLLGIGGVTKLRIGPGKDSSRLPGVRIIPTVHPAACLRQGDMFPNLVTDIGKVNRVFQPWSDPSYVVSDCEQHALDLLQAIDDYVSACGPGSSNPERILVTDIEVDIEKDTAFDHPNQYGMLCVGIGYDRSKVVVLSEGDMESGAVRDRLGKLFRKFRLVAQNGKFDLAGLYPLVGGLTLWFDTMLASYVIDERPGIHGLKYQAVEYLGAPQYDDEIKKYVGPGVGYGAIPRPLLYKYNATDVSCTYDLCYMRLDEFDRIASELPPGQRTPRAVHDLLVEASNQLMYVELNGITVDREYLRELDVQYLESLRLIEDDLDRIVGRISTVDYDKRGGINPRSPLQIKKFFADQNIRVDSTDKDTIELLLKRQSLPKNEEAVREFLQVLSTHRRESKMHGTYVKGIAKRLYRGRVYPTFLLHGTVTGRLSCRNPNLQNIPRESSIRRIFVPSKPENVFVSTDYSQAELRVLSFLAGDTYFRDIFNDGTVDVFDNLTPLLYPGKTKENTTKEEWKELRIRVKAYVYGVSYGRTEFSIALEFGIPTSEAAQGMRRFFEVIPEIVEFREATRQSVLAGNDLVTPWGRTRSYPLITKDNVKDVMNEALAFLPQSTASDMTLQAMGWIRQETKGFAYIRNIVHDNVMTECHQDDAEEVKEIQERLMIKSAETIVGDYVKFAVDTTTGKSWGEL